MDRTGKGPGEGCAVQTTAQVSTHIPDLVFMGTHQKREASASEPGVDWMCVLWSSVGSCQAWWLSTIHICKAKAADRERSV